MDGHLRFYTTVLRVKCKFASVIFIHPCVFESEILFFTLILAEKLGFLILGDAIYITRNAAIASPFTFFFSSYRVGVSHCRAWVIKGFTAHSNCLRRGTLHGPNSSGECWTDKQGGRAAGRHGGRWAAPMWLCGAGCWSGFHMQTHLPATPVFAVIDAKHTGSLLPTCLAFSFPLYLSPLLLALLISSPLLTHPFLHSTLSFLNRFLCNFSIPLFLLLLPLHWRDPCKKFCTFLYGEKPVNIPLANQEKRH